MLGILYRILPKSVNKCRRYGQKLIYASTQSMAFTEPILTKLIKTQSFWTYHLEFYANRTQMQKRKNTTSIYALKWSISFTIPTTETPNHPTALAGYVGHWTSPKSVKKYENFG